MLQVKAFNEVVNVVVSLSSYATNGSLAIQLWCEDGPYATLTVNLPGQRKENCAFVDTNNCPWATDLIQKNNLGVPTGEMRSSGFCVYLEYQFDIQELRKHTKFSDLFEDLALEQREQM